MRLLTFLGMLFASVLLLAAPCGAVQESIHLGESFGVLILRAQTPPPVVPDGIVPQSTHPTEVLPNLESLKVKKETHR